MNSNLVNLKLADLINTNSMLTIATARAFLEDFGAAWHSSSSKRALTCSLTGSLFSYSL